tara:strand:+ start:249 stop:599 length:351 start_codon:yes stop_codon:yes gene_type:complete
MMSLAPKFDLFDDSGDDDLNGVEILEGECKGLKYSYGVVSFNGLTEDGDVMEGTEPGVSFTYNIIDNPNDLEINDSVVEAMGQVLTVLLDAKFGSGGDENDESNDREDNPEQLGSE